MWNLTPDYLQQVKEELSGRRAAIEARHAQELKALEADLEEIEAIERLAYSFAVKHLPECAPGKPVAEPEAVAVLQPSPIELEEELEAAATWQPSLTEPVEPTSAPEAKGHSRWRMRLDKRSETEPA
jgi:hypothetical protein